MSASTPFDLVHNALTYLAEYLQTNAEDIPARWQSRWMIQLVTLGAFALAGGGYYSKSILRPIQAMMENARRIQKGDFNLEPIGQASAELAVMADTFSEMAGQVEKNIDVLKENAQLEQKLLREESERLAMQNLVTQAELLATLTFRIEDCRFFLVHSKKEVPKDLTGIDAILFGYSHKYFEQAIDGRLWLNPGSCGKRFRSGNHLYHFKNRRCFPIPPYGRA